MRNISVDVRNGCRGTYTVCGLILSAFYGYVQPKLNDEVEKVSSSTLMWETNLPPKAWDCFQTNMFRCFHVVYSHPFSIAFMLSNAVVCGSENSHPVHCMEEQESVYWVCVYMDVYICVLSLCWKNMPWSTAIGVYKMRRLKMRRCLKKNKTMPI